LLENRLIADPDPRFHYVSGSEHADFSKNSASRRHLVDWTSIVAEKLKLTSSTLHLAVRILDYFMDGHDIQVHRQEKSWQGPQLLKYGTVPASTLLSGYQDFSCMMDAFGGH
jgi:hypothetical protein